MWLMMAKLRVRSWGIISVRHPLWPLREAGSARIRRGGDDPVPPCGSRPMKGPARSVVLACRMHDHDLAAAFQFNLLTRLGLREEDYLLDIGCGALRAGRLFITYLLPGRYFGVEP